MPEYFCKYLSICQLGNAHSRGDRNTGRRFSPPSRASNFEPLFHVPAARVHEPRGDDEAQGLHILTSLAWLLLLLSQLVLIRQHRFDRHRAIGTSIFVAGPVLVATLTLLTVHSAAKDAVAGRVDVLVVQTSRSHCKWRCLCCWRSSYGATERSTGRCC